MALPTFEDDIERGLTSDEFDLHANVDAGDDRHGLDGPARKEIIRIMKHRKCTFDQARLIVCALASDTHADLPDAARQDASSRHRSP